MTADSFENWQEYYDVTECGVITNKSTGRILKPILNDKGYLAISISIKGKAYCRPVHRLVALKYIPNTENKPCVNHKDRNRANPHVSNLEWATYSENTKHSVANGGRYGWSRPRISEHNTSRTLQREQVEAMRDLLKLGYSQHKIARIFNITQSNVSKIKLGLTWRPLTKEQKEKWLVN